MKKEIQKNDQTINKLSNYIISLKKKHENEINTKKQEINRKLFEFNAESEMKMSEVNNLSQQVYFMKDKLFKLQNKITQEEKKKDEINHTISDSSETQIVNDLNPNVVVADEISLSEDDLQKKES